MGHWTLRYGLIKNILVLFALIKDYKRHVVLFSIKNYIKKKFAKVFGSLNTE